MDKNYTEEYKGFTIRTEYNKANKQKPFRAIATKGAYRDVKDSECSYKQAIDLLKAIIDFGENNKLINKIQEQTQELANKELSITDVERLESIRDSFNTITDRAKENLYTDDENDPLVYFK